MPALRTRMRARDVDEKHRVSSPLELLFDLTFVVAISQIAGQLASSIEQGKALSALGPYFMVFFAIWWAWMNFTWFASAYDTDDVPYRLLALLQMAGVLVLAAGVQPAFQGSNYLAITVGYFIMRVGLVSLWVRAARDDPAGRRTAIRYAVGVSVVQVLWIARFLLPNGGPWWVFVILVVLELSVPVYAERGGMSAWHPHHISERYGLFTIILLGESVLAATAGMSNALTDHGVTPELVVIAIAGLVLVFSLWWIYFSIEPGEGLAAHRDRSYFWGYGHYLVFAALGALGGGLEAAVQTIGGEVHASPTEVAYGVAIPVAIFVVLLWLLNLPIVGPTEVHPVVILFAVAVVLLAPLVAIPAGLAIALLAIALSVAALLAVTLVVGRGREA